MEFKKIALFGAAAFMMSCKGAPSKSTTTTMDFYSNYEEGDLYRIPLIRPYQIISADRGASWFYQGKGYELSNVEEAGVAPPIFVIYSASVYRPQLSGNVAEWLIVNTDTGEQTTAHSRDEFLQLLRQKKLTIRLKNITTVFEVFKRTGKLPDEWSDKK